MAPHPDVFVLIAEDVGERIEDAFTVADQRLAGAALQGRWRNSETSVGTKRIRCPERTDRAHRFCGDIGMRVVEQRDQHRAEARVGNLSDGGGHVLSGRGLRFVRVRREARQDLLARGDIALATAAREHDGGGRGNPRLRVLEKRPKQVGHLLLPDVHERRDGRCADLGTLISDHPLD